MMEDYVAEWLEEHRKEAEKWSDDYIKRILDTGQERVDRWKQARQNGTVEEDESWETKSGKEILSYDDEEFEFLELKATASLAILKEILGKRNYNATLERMRESNKKLKEKEHVEELVKVDDE
ncbi:MAG: hypothetical protein FWD44_02155, partial [Oscillospiraceae bacterium]|nr:hypothetical protein [Oscillospiraceae bacterium]